MRKSTNLIIAMCVCIVGCTSAKNYLRTTQVTPKQQKITTEHNATCILGKNGFISCKGEDRYNRFSTLPKVKFVDVALSQEGFCGIKESGKLLCTGHPDLRDNTPKGAYVQIVGGDDHMCALTKKGSVWCWGIHKPGCNLDAGINNDPHCWSHSIPSSGNMHAITDDTKQLSAGGHTTCYLEKDESWIKCFGSDEYEVISATPHGENYEQISVSTTHACTIKNGRLFCWGDKSRVVNDSTSPILNVPLGSSYKAVVTSRNYSCALTASGRVECWGKQIPQGLHGTTSVTHINISTSDTDEHHYCMIKKDNTILCGGDNLFGQAPKRWTP